MYAVPSLVCMTHGVYGGLASLDVSSDTEPSKQKQAVEEPAPDQLDNQKYV